MPVKVSLLFSNPGGNERTIYPPRMLVLYLFSLWWMPVTGVYEKKAIYLISFIFPLQEAFTDELINISQEKLIATCHDIIFRVMSHYSFHFLGNYNKRRQ
jgi:hypothetical protein